MGRVFFDGAGLRIMHELSITESILEITLRRAHEVGAAGVTDLYLVVGELSTVVDDSIQFYWDIISADTPAAGSRLHFHRVPAELTCLTCDHSYGPEDGLSCPRCAGINVRIDAGEEFYLEAIDIISAPAEPVCEQT